MTQISEPYCTVKVSVIDIDYNISEQEFLFQHAWTNVKELTLDIKNKTVLHPQEKENHNG